MQQKEGAPDSETTTNAPPALDAGVVAQRALNEAICAATGIDQLFSLVGENLGDLGTINAVTAFHRVAKARASPVEKIAD